MGHQWTHFKWYVWALCKKMLFKHKVFENDKCYITYTRTLVHCVLRKLDKCRTKEDEQDMNTILMSSQNQHGNWPICCLPVSRIASSHFWGKEGPNFTKTGPKIISTCLMLWWIQANLKVSVELVIIMCNQHNSVSVSAYSHR